MEDSPFFTEELLQQMNKFFIEEVALLRQLNNVEELRIKQAYPLLVSIIDNSKSMSLLGNYNLINDMYMIARSYVERMVNFLYYRFAMKMILIHSNCIQPKRHIEDWKGQLQQLKARLVLRIRGRIKSVYRI
ncbi:hypothetical protein ABH897_004692 [Paenibacillus sp. RC73]